MNLTAEQMEMRLFHLTELPSTPIAQMYNLKNATDFYLHLVDRLPSALERDLLRLNAINTSTKASAVLTEDLLLKGEDSVVSSALERCWETTEKVEVKDLHRIVAGQFFDLIHESEEFNRYFDGWGHFHGEQFIFPYDLIDYSGLALPFSLDGDDSIFGAEVRDFLEVPSPLDLFDFEDVSHYYRDFFLSALEAMGKTPPMQEQSMGLYFEDEDDTTHAVFNDEVMIDLEENGQLPPLALSMFRAQELLTQERVQEFADCREEYNWEWALASFDWCGGMESEFIKRMQSYVARAPYTEGGDRHG